MFSAIGIFLSLVGSRVSSFMSKNWKWVVPVVAAILLSLLALRAYNNAIDAAYNKGKNDYKALIQKQIKTEDDKNREIERILSNNLTKFVDKINNEKDKRTEQSTVYHNTIKEIIKNNPVYEQCIVDKSVIEERNRIRALGPNIGEAK